VPDDSRQKPGIRSRDVRHYFVDEAGDPVLFSRKGKILVGTKGCSRFFAVGLLEVDELEHLRIDLERLRRRLLADPYFRGVPSMQPEQKKTALAFHAKDDVPEVRREVFSCLSTHELRFLAVVRDKRAVLDYVRQRNERDESYRYDPAELYDVTVSRLFKDKLHKADEYSIVFARRGKSDRTKALLRALDVARRRFYERWGITSDAAVRIYPKLSRKSAGLQAADYLLWALQRLFERGEDRFVKLLWHCFRLVQDVDDTTEAAYGVYYTQRRPVDATVGRWRKGI